MSEEISTNRKTALKTLRLPEELLLYLQKEAEEEGTTLNALVSTILLRHSRWEGKARKLGMIHVSKKLFVTVLEATDEQKLATLVRQKMPTVDRNMAMFWFNDDSLEAIVRLVTLLSRYSWAEDVSVKRDGKQYMMSFSHELGPRFSLILRNTFDELLRTSYHIQPTITSSDALVTVTFSEM